jgi:uncharacterized protein YaaQ
MKLIIAVVQDEYVQSLMKEFVNHKYKATKLASTGGFLRSGNTTLLMGVEDYKVDDVLTIIGGICKPKIVENENKEVDLGGANVFIMDINDFRRM